MKKNEFLQKLLMGSKEGESLPKTRKKQLLYILKDRYGFLICLSFLSFLFIIPILCISLVLSYRLSSLTDSNAIFSIHFIYGILMIIGYMIMSIGLAGLMYVVRKMVYGEIYHFKDFGMGIKNNYRRFLLISFIFGISFFIMIIDLSYYGNFSPLDKIYNYLFISIGIIQFLVILIMSFYMFTLEVRYVQTFKDLLKNSFAFTIRFLFKNILISLIVVFPWIIIIIVPGIVQILVLSIMLFVYFGFNSLLLTIYTASLYDTHINKKQYPELFRKGLNLE